MHSWAVTFVLVSLVYLGLKAKAAARTSWIHLPRYPHGIHRHSSNPSGRRHFDLESRPLDRGSYWRQTITSSILRQLCCAMACLYGPSSPSNHHLNVHQFHRCDYQRTSRTRGRHSVGGKVRTACVSRLFASECCRLVAGVLKDSIAELRKDEEKRISLYVHDESLGVVGVNVSRYRFITAIQEEISALRESEDKQTVRLVSPEVFDGLSGLSYPV